MSIPPSVHDPPLLTNKNWASGANAGYVIAQYNNMPGFPANGDYTFNWGDGSYRADYYHNARTTWWMNGWHMITVVCSRTF